MKQISVVQLGFLKRHINLRKLKQWKSKLFSIDTVDEISCMPESEPSNSWQYLSDDEIRKVLQHKGDSDITLVVTEYRLEDNFYMRRVDNVVVTSLFEVGDILQYYHIPIEHFIVKNIYEIVTLLHIYQDLPNTRDEIPEIFHDETRSCLFDISGLKADIVYFFTGKPSLCSQCEAYLVKKQLPKNFLKYLICEIRRLRKPTFSKIYDFVKCHPVWSIVIAIIGQLVIGFLAGLLANYLFFLFKG
jgi:hypothetical protein